MLKRQRKLVLDSVFNDFNIKPNKTFKTQNVIFDRLTEIKNSGINFVYAKYGYGKERRFYKYSIKRFKILIQVFTSARKFCKLHTLEL